MDPEKLRREISFEAARLLQARKETDFDQARWRAARAITRSRIPPEAMPTDLEIRHALQELLVSEHRGGCTVDPADRNARRAQVFRRLLAPLDRVLQDRDLHPEGDVLYHSLQVFELVRQARPWDEDLLLAALLHDVGKGLDPRDHVHAGIAVLTGLVSERTLWLIENLEVAQRLLDGAGGARARRRLSTSEDSDALDVLARADREGRLPGRKVCTIDEALEFILALDAGNDDPG